MGTVSSQVTSGSEEPGATELPHRVRVAAGNATSIPTPRAALTRVPSHTRNGPQTRGFFRSYCSSSVTVRGVFKI